MPKEQPEGQPAQTGVMPQGTGEASQANETERTQQPPRQVQIQGLTPRKRGRPRKNAQANQMPAQPAASEQAAKATTTAIRISTPAQGRLLQPIIRAAPSRTPMPEAIAPPEKNLAATGAIKQFQAAKTTPAKPRKKSGKLSRFDKDAVKLIQHGTQSVQRISSILGVDAGEAQKRFLEMEKRGLLAFDVQAPDRITLTIRGYNDLKLSPRMESQVEKTIAKNAEEKQVQLEKLPPRNEIEVLGEKPVEPPHEKIDLAELLRRGAPKDAGVFVKRAERRQGAEEKVVIERKSIDAQTTELLKKTMQAYEGEKCELCRGDFRLALSDGHPKYGHCFCGAAFHHDCYDTLSDENGSCPRCGRSLEIILDRQSQEAVNAIKKLFE